MIDLIRRTYPSRRGSVNGAVATRILFESLLDVVRRPLASRSRLVKWWAMAKAMAVCVAFVASGCNDDATPVEHPERLIVIGIDGMDFELTSQMLADGRLPNLAKIAREGSFKALGTSIPPQSPVAWSNMMTGTDGGGHGVFDFIRRDAMSGRLLSSAADFEPPDPLPVIGHGLDDITAFGYTIPIRSTKLKINRHSRPFWEFLTEAGVPAHIYRMPANYPPPPSHGAEFRCLSDMGTVDLRHTLGTLSYFTSDPKERDEGSDAIGATFHVLEMKNDRAESAFVGRPNTYAVTSPKDSTRTMPRPSTVPFTIYRDPVESVAGIRFGGRDVILSVGEWSEWVPIEFEMIPHLLTLKGICRFYLKEVHPHLRLYVSPFNLDPQEPSWEIDQPKDFSVTVSNAIGRYYTQGLPEDTEALNREVLSPDEFLAQAEIVLQERLRLLEFALDHYAGGMLFFYFGSTDQVSHMFWGARNPDHPGVTPEFHEKHKHVVEDLYVRMDAVMGNIAGRFPKAALMVMSDHGFCDYRRSFNPNTWLRDNGYATMRDPNRPDLMANIKATETRAYGVGFSGLYINLKGRERGGIVAPADMQVLMDEIAAKLKAYRDPKDGAQVVAEVYQTRNVFSGPMLVAGPDMVLGYARGYRTGNQSAMCRFPEQVIEDNLRAWNADHMTAPHLVPGVLFTNRPVIVDDPDLLDLAPTILGRFGLSVPDGMRGRDLFDVTTAQATHPPNRPAGMN